MTYSNASVERPPQVIRVSKAQMTPDPVRGYTTSDFWQELNARQARAAQESARFKRMVERPHEPNG